MKTSTDTTIVIFRRWKSKKNGGGILALFPAEKGDTTGRYCSSYEHVGQHGQADYQGCLKVTVPAKPKEYQALKRELESYPYNYKLSIRKRYTKPLWS